MREGVGDGPGGTPIAYAENASSAVIPGRDKVASPGSIS